MTASRAPILFPVHHEPTRLQLRPLTPGDLPTLFKFEHEPDANYLAGTLPRDLSTFSARWAQALADPAVVPRAIIEGATMVGCICAFKQDGKDSIGYWIGRDHWGKGHATRAIALILQEVLTRPLSARVAVHNTASRRALERNGFVITDRRYTPASDRYAACERFTFTLA